MTLRTGRGRRGTWIQLLILRILYEAPLHGYALNEKINRYLKGRRPLKPGSLYTILRRMEKDGLLESTWDEESSKVNRRVYELSEQGIHRLAEGRSIVDSQMSILIEMKQFYNEYFRDDESNDRK
jgi:DNA-binding PadR family transcriptional regulator